MVWSSNDSVKNFKLFYLYYGLEFTSQFMEYNYIVYVKIN